MRLLIAVTTLAVFASAAPAGVGPDAKFKKSPRHPQAGQVVRLDASSSKCKRCRYRWHQMKRGKARLIGKGKVLQHRFWRPGAKRIRLTVINRNGRKDRSFKKIRIQRRKGAPRTPSPGNAALPPLGRPSCVPGAVPATSAAQARQALGGGNSVCITAAIGNLDLDDLPSAGNRYVGTTDAGAIDEVHLQESSGLTLRARFTSIIIRQSDRIIIEQSLIGGTPASRTMDQLIFIPERSDDVTIRDNDIGWTTADNSGNTGYGIRAYNESARLRIERNYIHHIGGDAMQIGMNGPDTLIDRNEVAYAAKRPAPTSTPTTCRSSARAAHARDQQLLPPLRLGDRGRADDGLQLDGHPRRHVELAGLREQPRVARPRPAVHRRPRDGRLHALQRGVPAQHLAHNGTQFTGGPDISSRSAAAPTTCGSATSSTRRSSTSTGSPRAGPRRATTSSAATRSIRRPANAPRPPAIRAARSRSATASRQACTGDGYGSMTARPSCSCTKATDAACCAAPAMVPSAPIDSPSR